MTLNTENPAPIPRDRYYCYSHFLYDSSSDSHTCALYLQSVCYKVQGCMTAVLLLQEVARFCTVVALVAPLVVHSSGCDQM
jgi:hypothetical protein